MAYFLLSIATRENLDLCLEYGWAGFTNSTNGLWTFLDIEEGDYVSFLYGARVHDLYRVIGKVALKNAENLPPWPQVTFRSGYTYYFPFRLLLQRTRKLNEPMVRAEFAYVAENLLLRGGYRRTHFQADSVTFHQASRMGIPADRAPRPLQFETFVPQISFKEASQPPYVFHFRELFLQALLRKHLSTPQILKNILTAFGIDEPPTDFEVLGEKALPEGFVDLVIKRKYPVEKDTLLLVEVKTGKASVKDAEQLANYLRVTGDESVGGILIAKGFPKKLCKQPPPNIALMQYTFEGINIEQRYDALSLLKFLSIQIVC